MNEAGIYRLGKSEDAAVMNQGAMKMISRIFTFSVTALTLFSFLAVFIVNILFEIEFINRPIFTLTRYVQY